MAVLDTTLLIDVMRETRKRTLGRAVHKLHELVMRGDSLRVTLFTIGELYVGVSKGTRPARERKAIENALLPFQVVSFERRTAELYGQIVGHLERRGIPISDMDALIAATALELNEVLVTRNPRHFHRVPGIQVETY